MGRKPGKCYALAFGLEASLSPRWHLDGLVLSAPCLSPSFWHCPQTTARLSKVRNTRNKKGSPGEVEVPPRGILTPPRGVPNKPKGTPTETPKQTQTGPRAPTRFF